MHGSVSCSAYLIAADPAWSAQSVAAYYDFVERVVVAYDVDSSVDGGWDVDETIARILKIDRDHKVILLPGGWQEPGETIAASTLRQREDAFACAAEFGQWVLQLASDDIALSPMRLVRSVADAEHCGAKELWYPVRLAVQRTRSGKLMERATRGGKPLGEYPGPVAVHVDAPLVGAQQAPAFQVRLAAEPNQASHQLTPLGTSKIVPDEAIVRLSGVRTTDQMRMRLRLDDTLNEAEKRDYMATWHRQARFPHRSMWLNRIRRPQNGWLRVADNPIGDGAGDYDQE